MASEVAAVVQMASATAAMIATGESTREKIYEARRDYKREIARLKEAQSARETVMTSEIGRTKNIGIAELTETGKQAAYETNEAMRKTYQTASAAESRIGAGGIRASGTAAAAAQQETDIAYAGARRTMESGEAKMKIGGLQLGNQLQAGQEQKSLLTMEYQQNIKEQQTKLKELEENTTQMVTWAYLGGLAGVTSSFYESTKTNLWDFTKKK